MATTILTDIEGTTSSIRFVKDVLFPYARREFPRFVREHGNDPEVRRWLDEHGIDLGNSDVEALHWLVVDALTSEVHAVPCQEARAILLNQQLPG